MVTENVFGEGGNGGQERSERVFDLQSVEGGMDEGEILQAELSEVEEFERGLAGPDYWEIVRKFLSLTGGSIVYCLCALSIIYGIGQIVGPALADSYEASQTMPAVGVLNLYEICLLGALIYIVVRRKVTDDAVSLVLLIALFLVGTGLTLGTIAPTSFWPCLSIGIGCVGLGAGKLYAMRKFVSLRIGVLSFVGLMIVLMWNFLGSPLMAWAFVLGEWTDETRHGQWMLSWLVMIVGAGFIIAEAMLVKGTEIAANRKGNPFIRTYAMVWVFGLALLTAAGGHQYAVSYMFVIDWVWGDYIPLAAVMALLGIELLRCWGRSFEIEFGEVVLACVPLLLMAVAIDDRAVNASFLFGSEVIAYPPVLLAIVGGVVCLQGVVHRREFLIYAALAYAFSVLLTVGFDASNPYDLNWRLCGSGVIAAVTVIGIVKRNPVVCFLAVSLASFGLAVSQRFNLYVDQFGMSQVGAVAAVMGLGCITISLVFGMKTHKVIVILGSICLMAGMFDFLGGSLGVKDVVVGVVAGGLCAGLWFRVRNVPAVLLVGLPFVPKLLMLPGNMSSWAFVVLSFVLLFAGIVVSSLCKESVSGEVEPD
ncbi:MAG: hypothetical protein KAS23_09270 [Anaerohalosphaera sp.]|nr:hypothetical protein [Anaerohalosphaera sp.]